MLVFGQTRKDGSWNLERASADEIEKIPANISISSLLTLMLET